MCRATIPLDQIRTDGGTQARAELDQDAIDDYADNLDALPPADVFRDESGIVWLARGFHRLEAHLKKGRKGMPCHVHDGTLDDAKWMAAGTDNETAGLRRSHADKIAAVKMALAVPGSSKKSDSEIAKHCGVDHKTVGKYRAELAPEAQLDTHPPKLSIGNSQYENQQPGPDAGNDTRTRRDGKPFAVSSEARSDGQKQRHDNEKQALFAKLHPDVLAAWNAKEEGLTLGHIKKWADLRAMLQFDELTKFRERRDKPKVSRADAPVHVERLADANGTDVPDDLLDVFGSLSRFFELGLALRGVVTSYKDLMATPAGHYLLMGDLKELERIVEAIREAAPLNVDKKRKCGFSCVGAAK